MRLKFLFIVGLGLGYIFGARAGRPRYEQLKSTATQAWEDPRVQKVVTNTRDYVTEHAPIVREKVVSGTRSAVAGTQDAAERASGLARKAGTKAVGTSKAVSGRVATTTKDASEKARDTSKKVAQSTREVSGKARDASQQFAKSTREASGKARDTSKKVAKAAQDATGSVSDTAKRVRGRIVDRGEEVVDGMIIAAGTARDEALDTGQDDDEK